MVTSALEMGAATARSAVAGETPGMPREPFSSGLVPPGSKLLRDIRR
jgi:hypothetical protein